MIRIYKPNSDYDTYKSPHKLYVSVIADHVLGGHIQPLSFTMEDGRSFKIEHVLFNEQRTAKMAGGQGIMYRIRFSILNDDGGVIRVSEASLFHDRDDWYIETEKPIAHSEP